MKRDDFLLVGLGNPGKQYHHTRHNIGFVIVSLLRELWGGTTPLLKWQGEYVSLRVLGQKIHLLMPMTYMNRSGEAVCQYYRFFNIAPDRLLVIHDDIDMAAARIKLCRGGGDGGHKGIRSIVEKIGGRDFYRLKIGIGRPGKAEVHPAISVDKYVLGQFSEGDQDLLECRQKDLVNGIELFISDGPEKAMGLLNSLK